LRASSALEPTLPAFVSVNAANARLAAEASDKAIRTGHAVGPLYGVPVAIKDFVEIEGEVAAGGTLRTTTVSPSRNSRRPPDATSSNASGNRQPGSPWTAVSTLRWKPRLLTKRAFRSK
jgi:hypothetical protein